MLRKSIKSNEDGSPDRVGEVRVVDSGVVKRCVLEVKASLDTIFHDALKPFSLTVPSDVSFMNSEFPVETILPMIILEQNVPINGESARAPSLISTKSNTQLPEFSR